MESLEKTVPLINGYVKMLQEYLSKDTPSILEGAEVIHVLKIFSLIPFEKRHIKDQKCKERSFY